MDRTSRICSALLLVSGMLLCMNSQVAAQTSSVEYVDRSSETGISMTGLPTNASNLNVEANQYKDLLISRSGIAAMGWSGNGLSGNGAPMFLDNSNGFFPSGAPSGYGTGYAAADFDNDGWVDFFYCEPNGGAKLYRNMGGNGFQNWTTASGLSTWQGYIQDTGSCAWGDYDGDGFLDLATVTDGYPNGELRVYHNAGGTFDAVVLEGYYAGLSPLWADFDNDDDLDLIVLDSEPDPTGPPPGYVDRCFINQGDGTFVDEGWDRIGELEHYYGFTIAVPSDVDKDGDIDIMYGREQFVSLLENDGSGYFTLVPIVEYDSNYIQPTGISVLDYDLDGYPDVLSSWYGTSGHKVSLLRGSANGTYTESAVGAAINSSLETYGIAPGDYAHDGFTDVYFARPTSQPFFYKARPATGYSKGSWVGIHLESQHGANNATGVGAVVKVTAGTNVYTQIVDGAGGYASQHDRDLPFGLGTYSGTVDVEVRWPNGHTQIGTDLAVNQYHTVLDDSPVINDTQIFCSKVFHENGQEDWVFTWYTYYSSDRLEDKVIFDFYGVPTRCLPPYEVLEDGLDDVVVDSVVSENGMYKHTVTLQYVDCEARCTVPYVVESGFDDCKDESADKTLKTQYCAQLQ
jgi:hypothetical protein